jgi:tetratricopeptide (TPR) repeat protein
VKLHWQISAGEFFELLRPAALVIAAIVSAWVLSSARRWRFRSYFAAAWVLGAFFLPFVLLPLYLIARAARKRDLHSSNGIDETAADQPSTLKPPPARFRFLFPFAYCCLLLSLIAFYFYRDYYTVDAYLARAVQAKLMGRREKTMGEYRAALALEDSPHIHKLLGIELAEVARPQEALREFQLAERGGEPDESLPFRIGQVLDDTGNHPAATIEFRRFLESQACRQALPDDRCEGTRARLQTPPAN